MWTVADFPFSIAKSIADRQLPMKDCPITRLPDCR
jgi:hypothetical protein